MNINMYYKNQPYISYERLDFWEKRDNIILPKEYKTFINEYNGGILCKNKYHFIDLYGKDCNIKIRLLYSLIHTYKQIIDDEYDNYLCIGQSFTDYNNYISDDDITINLLNGNICLYDQSYHYVMAKSFNEFIEKIIYDYFDIMIKNKCELN